MASSVDTPVQGFSSAQARPLTIDTPMRMPVKEPGPCATASRSTSLYVSSAFLSMSSPIGSSVLLWVRPLHWLTWLSSFPSLTRAAEAALAEDSNARISMPPPPRW